MNGKVYCGGGWTYNDEEQYNVYCYDPSEDVWTTLPPLPVRWFGLGQVNGALAAYGGERKKDSKQTNEVHMYDEKSKKWKRTLLPMPTARYAISVLSLQSELNVVVGGATGTLGDLQHTSVVEVFKSDVKRWYRTDSLQTACSDVSLVAIGNICYAVGGYHGSHGSLNQALYASFDDLLGNAVQANQTTHDGSYVTQSAWKTLPNTPTCGPAAAVLCGSLFVIGGQETPIGEADKKEIYMYSPSTNSWIYVSDLPAPRSRATVAILSSTEILVIGGEATTASGYTNTLYKGTLYLKYGC